MAIPRPNRISLIQRGLLKHGAFSLMAQNHHTAWDGPAPALSDVPRAQTDSGGNLLLRPSEKSPVNGLREDVALNRFHHIGAGVEGIGPGFYIELGIERVELEHIVMRRTVRGR